MGNLTINMGIRVAAVYMIIALVDFIYQKRKFHTDMMMTKQEVKDEMKESEGDPQIKSKQRQRMREASQRRMMQELPKADVVITNPTHYAVAIQYDQEKYNAPIVLAKGADYLAKKIKEIAKENDVEIVENKPLARMLYANVEIGAVIPPELYKAVAEVLAFVYHLKGKV
jgi:flagellar biosynthetic protein FlhB